MVASCSRKVRQTAPRRAGFDHSPWRNSDSRSERMASTWASCAKHSVVKTEESGVRRLVPLRWGLIPAWAKEPSIGNRMINALAETLSQKPSFRHAFKKRRCLIVADGFFEWQKRGAGKVPLYIRL